MFLLIIVLSLICREVFSICDKDVRINVTKHIELDNKIPGENNSFWKCVYNKKECIRKCCQKNEVFKEMKCEKNENQNELNLFLKRCGLTIENMYIVYSQLYCDAKNNLYKIQLDEFVLYQNGSVFVEEINYTFSLENYCLEINSRSDGDKVVVFICGPSDGTLDFILKATGVNIGKCFNSAK